MESACSAMIERAKSLIVTMATSRSWSITGRWRIRLLVITAIACQTRGFGAHGNNGTGHNGTDICPFGRPSSQDDAIAAVLCGDDANAPVRRDSKHRSNPLFSVSQHSAPSRGLI